MERFAGRLEKQTEFDESLALEYNRLKRALAASFQEMALETVPRDQYPLNEVKSAVISQMRSLFAGRADSHLLVIRRYTTPHPDLYALLAAKVNEPVPAWRLRLLSGDKTHTERRTRELRDLGLEIEVLGEDDEPTYRLVSLQPDLIYGAAYQLRENVIKSRTLSAFEKELLRRLAEETAELPPRRSANDGD
ncbi:hypothetical protein [Aquipuribacter sp. SD81]|uniref:hypothetical protein n=1 Tax=Aquipuribacter sp. SD81 TaxID=3127703 RepID=UPI00301A8FC0